MLQRGRALPIAAFGAALLVVAAGFGCGPSRPAARQSRGRDDATGVGAPRFVDPETGATIDTDAIAIDFGRVRLGSFARREVRIRNEGAANFAVVAVETSAAFPSAFEFTRSVFSVRPEDPDVTWFVTFTPSTEGEAIGSLRLVVEHGDRSAMSIDLRGTGYAAPSPEIEVVPSPLDFGAVASAADGQVRRLIIANAGAHLPGTSVENLRLGLRGKDGAWLTSPPEITGPDARDFGVDWPPPEYPPEGLAEGEAVELTVRFGPTTSALGRRQATLVLVSNDPTRPTIEVPVTASRVELPPCDIAVGPPTLNFGVVEESRSLTLPFTIENRDPNPDHACRLARIDLESGGDAFALADGPLADLSLAGGAARVVPVRFSPQAQGTFEGSVAIVVAGSPAPALRVHLSGVARSTCFKASPSEDDFGTVGLGCPSREHTLLVSNICNRAAVLTSVGIGQGASSQFSIVKKPALPARIAAGGQAEIRVKYLPDHFGSNAIRVEVGTEDGPLMVPILGRGAELPIQTDLCFAPPEPKVDVLFVIDNSSSMADKQASLASNLDHFIRYAQQGRFPNFHIAVTTSDVSATGEAGRLLPISGANPRVITPSTPNATLVFNQNATVGTSGSDTEALLRAANLALSDPLLTGDNAGFFRDDAKLYIVLVSDGADTDPLDTPVSFYETFFLGLKSFRNDFFLAAVIPTLPNAPANCSYDSANAGMDARVKTLVEHTGGLLAEICDPNWAKELEILGTTYEYWGTTCRLSRVPELSIAPEPIAITVDGAPYPRVDARGFRRFHYEDDSNSVVFDPLALSMDWTSLEITYHVACSYF